MFSCKRCQSVPVYGGRGALDGGGLVEVESRAVWGGPGGVYALDGAKWERVAEGIREWATLAVHGGELVCVGGRKDGGGYSKEVMVWRDGRWAYMCNMIEGCKFSCIFNTSGVGLVVMGGDGDGVGIRNIQVFDGKTWHFGPPLPDGCYRMSAVVQGDMVFVMGGVGMKQAVWSANITDLVSN